MNKQEENFPKYYAFPHGIKAISDLFFVSFSYFFNLILSFSSSCNG